MGRLKCQDTGIQPSTMVNHQILLSTLLRKGISGTALQWFESYLSDRYFKVSWRGEISKSQHLVTGVPQGSVLGPLLFSVYMASLGSVIQKQGFSYQGSCLFVTYTIIQGIISSEMEVRTGPLNGQCKKNKNKRWYITQEHIFTYRKE